MIVASLAVRHHGCLTESLTGDARAAQISAAHTGDVLVMHAREPARVDQFYRDIVADQPRAPRVLDRTPTSIVLRVANPAGGVVERILASGCTIAWPASYADGVERYRVLAGDRAMLEAAVTRVREVGDVRIEHVTDAPNEGLDINVSVAHLVADMTERQVTLLRAALDAGLYASPRRTTIAKLAREQRLAPTTLSEHLRKAEARVLARFSEILDLAPVLARGAARRRGRPRKGRAPGATTARRRPKGSGESY